MSTKKNKVADFLPMRLANDVIGFRTKHGLTIKKLSKMTGVGEMAIYRLETGDIPKLENYFRICNAMGKPMDYYFKKPKSESANRM